MRSLKHAKLKFFNVLQLNKWRTNEVKSVKNKPGSGDKREKILSKFKRIFENAIPVPRKAKTNAIC